MNPFRPISISLSPNTQRDDIWQSFKLIFQPWKYIKGNGVEILEEKFKEYIGIKHVFSFNSGRSALFTILNSLELEKGDEILLQAFTCNAVPNPAIWLGLKPIYVDIDESFNIDAEDLKMKITSKSKAVVVQHTFGTPANLDAIVEICRENNLILIEDCAHSLGATYKGKKVGTIGDISFFSFSRDKVISSVYGGMIATDNEVLAGNICKYAEKVKSPSKLWVLQQLLHPVLMNWIILPTYRLLGKYCLVIFQQLGILSKAVHYKEKMGEMPKYFSKKMPNALAFLALKQLKKIDKFNNHRKEIAEFYSRELINSKYKILDTKYKEGNIFLRFCVRHSQAHQIIRKFWNRNILIGDWYTSVIAPFDTKLEKMQYIFGFCPKAEKMAKETLNLPTHINISKKEAQKIVDLLKLWR